MTKNLFAPQASLFAPTITIIEPAQTPSGPPLTPPPLPESLSIEITRADLIEQIMQSLVRGRRWEKELTLGASDEELARAFGTCWISNHTHQVHFTNTPEPAATCTTPAGKELFTFNAAEIAQQVRKLAQIPPDPGPTERARLLKERLDKERLNCKINIYSVIKSLLNDTSRSKQTGFTQPAVDLLFAEDCLTETGERHLLETLTTMLQDCHWPAAKAMTTALLIVERARGTWTHLEGYWVEPIN